MTATVDSCEELKEAVKSAGDDDQRRQYLIKRSIDLGCVEEIPDEWEMEIDNG